MSEDTRPSVVIVDDHRMWRSGVRAELGDTVDIVGEAGDVDEACVVIEAREPDVVLLDVHMPGGGGREVLNRVLPNKPDIKFLALSGLNIPVWISARYP